MLVSSEGHKEVHAPGLSPWLARGLPLAASSHGPPSVHHTPGGAFCVQSSSKKDTSQTGLGPTLMTSFYKSNLITFKDPVFIYSHILRY